jgi:POT family proton-dependent oligopeptide transporter
LVKSLLKGDAEASLMYGAYTGLVYAAPVLGGRMADQFLGYRYAIMLGAVLMAIGEFILLGGTEMFGFDMVIRNHFVLIGMGAIIVGNGYFKANISTIVGKLYKEGDPRRDSGFTIFYIGINVGAGLATLVVSFVGETYGFEYGFGLAGIGMLMGLFIFWFGRDKYKDAPGLDVPEAGRKKMLGPLNGVQTISIGSLLLIPICYILINNNIIRFESFEFPLMMVLLFILFLYVAYSLIKTGISEGPMWRDRMIALIIFMVINIVFLGMLQTQFFNPLFIILFGSIFSVMWVKLDKIGKNPSIPMKFSLGIFQLGLGFLVTLIGMQFVDNFQVPLLTLVFLYMLHTTGELFLSPIGLSMVTKLAPLKIAATAMGGWFLSFSIANYLAGGIASLTGAEEGAAHYTIAEGLDVYIGVFSTLGIVLIGFAILIALISKPLNKLMHGIT